MPKPDAGAERDRDPAALRDGGLRRDADPGGRGPARQQPRQARRLSGALPDQLVPAVVGLAEPRQARRLQPFVDPRPALVDDAVVALAQRVAVEIAPDQPRAEPLATSAKRRVG